jgi:ATP-dependent helicase HrpA
VAAELVETGRRYLRTAAAIEPAWLEPLAAHLVKRSYSEPHWEKKRAQVVAFESVTLYGLPLVQQRKIDFGRIDPAVSRQLFIRHALVNGEWQTREAFAAHNRRLLQDLEELEAKSRRRDLIVDEEQLYAFFDARLPVAVFDSGSFLRWWKAQRQQQPDLLELQRDAIMRHPAEAVTEQQFPDSMRVRGLQLPVTYRFAPGSDRDGLSVRVPLAALNQLQANDFDWLVPGMLKEKCALLIKSLPKPLRRHFVPAPDFAEACLQGADTASGNLLTFLETRLQRMTGVRVPPDAWRPELLPAHLSVVFEIVDEGSRVLAEGRDLEALKQRLGPRAQQDFSGLADAVYERRDLQDWDFGTLPEYVELQRDGVRLRGYPALSVADGRVDLCLFDQPGKAREAHREGLLALFRKRSGSLLKDLKRSFPNLDKQVLWFSTVAGPTVLQADLERAALQAAFLADASEIRETADFQQRLATGRAQLLMRAVEIGTWTYQTLEAYQNLQRALKSGLTPAQLAVISDVRAQIDQLVYPGFVSATPLQWLPHLARYLLAADRRLQQAPANLARDREHALLVARYWQRYRQAVEQGGKGAELVKFRWLIEELRVSLFAQSLGTAEKVSPQRLDRLWQAIQA